MHMQRRISKHSYKQMTNTDCRLVCMDKQLQSGLAGQQYSTNRNQGTPVMDFTCMAAGKVQMDPLHAETT